MRKLLLGSAALTASIALSGCSFLGIGGHDDYRNYQRAHAHHGAHHGHQAKQSCGSTNCLSRWNLEGGIGPSFVVDGTAVTGGRTNAGSAATIRNISMNDAYDTGWRGELGASYALTPNTKVTALGFVEEADSAGAVNWGTVGDQALTGALSDYQSYGGELGLRHYFAPTRGIILNSVRPYVEGRVGLAQVDDIAIEGAQLGGDAFNGGAPVAFYDDSLVGTAAGLVGFETPLTRYSTIALETGVRYSGGLDSDNSVLAAGNPLAGINNGGERVTIPVMLRGRYRF